MTNHKNQVLFLLFMGLLSSSSVSFTGPRKLWGATSSDIDTAILSTADNDNPFKPSDEKKDSDQCDAEESADDKCSPCPSQPYNENLWLQCKEAYHKGVRNGYRDGYRDGRHDEKRERKYNHKENMFGWKRDRDDECSKTGRWNKRKSDWSCDRENKRSCYKKDQDRWNKDSCEDDDKCDSKK